MRIFWLQGGLHFEPDTPEEGQALRVVFETSARSSIGAQCLTPSAPKLPFGETADSSTGMGD
jgi:hypothetical protein